MVKQTIQIYCRVKPTKSKTSVLADFDIQEELRILFIGV
jgi:hypothetical protein